MRELFVLLAHLLTTLVKLWRRGGLHAVVAESLAVKHQLQVMNRTRRRAPRLTPWDRLIQKAYLKELPRHACDLLSQSR